MEIESTDEEMAQAAEEKRQENLLKVRQVLVKALEYLGHKDSCVTSRWGPDTTDMPPCNCGLGDMSVEAVSILHETRELNKA
jgi:hypothetical protein